ncbi:MAG: HD domain-containing protein [Firmicutes bacterium]|jgi:putative hydrolase of HD superfamily|nr:HD domain-containing protein [Bacillota bacterium]
MERLKKQIEFLIEIDKIKHVFRKTRLFDGSRYENDAEHAWHLALMAMVLSEHANKEIDVAKVIKMVLIHDIVEIDAGDVMVYDQQNRQLVTAKESAAAERIFGLLPVDQKEEFISLWAEFEARETPEAKFAAAIDRLQPILQNHLNDYHAWRAYGVSFAMLHASNRHVREGSEAIWNIVQQIFADARDKGALIQEPNAE